MGISGQTIWRQTGNFLLTQKIIRKITYYEPGFREHVRRDWKVAVGREHRCSHLDSERETDDEATCIVSVMNVATWIVSARNCLGSYC